MTTPDRRPDESSSETAATAPDAADTAPDVADTPPDAADTPPDAADTAPDAAEAALHAAELAFERGDYAAARALLGPLTTTAERASPAPIPDAVADRARALAAAIGGDRGSQVLALACAVAYVALVAHYVLG